MRSILRIPGSILECCLNRSVLGLFVVSTQTQLHIYRPQREFRQGKSFAHVRILRSIMEYNARVQTMFDAFVDMENMEFVSRFCKQL
jgi:hypothetical protein